MASPPRTAAEPGPNEPGAGRAPDRDGDGERRKPQQSRGRQRVDRILAAAAEIVAEVGVAGMTIHAVAQRSRTTTGSIYHFFRDRNDIVRALAERHRIALMELQQGAAGEAETWASLPIARAVNRFLTPFLDYIERHPDLLSVLQASAGPNERFLHDEELDEAGIGLTESFVAARTPGISPPERRARAIMCHAIIEGTLAVMTRVADPSAQVLVRELERAVVEYLRSFEEPR